MRDSHPFSGIAGSENATFAARAHGYGFPSIRVDGNDYLAVYASAKWASLRARRNLEPTLIEMVTYRAAAHSSSDDPSKYRPKEESDAWPLGDPIERFKNHPAVRKIWSQERHDQTEAEIDDDVLSLQKEAESYGTLHDGGSPSVGDMFEGVYKEKPPHLRDQRKESGA